ncbi:MAG: aconitase X catalytic domain-containing protein [Methanomicrobiales archaeon]|nr:aconitase X catalytic domain-containing protein [Methanomicrobiales archaeon]
MRLDPEDQAILQGEEGETRQRMMEILIALGKVFGAEELIPISSAQVSGASYKTIGEWGLRWLQSINARVAVPTILNPIGMPREGWEEHGIHREFAEKQLAILEAYRRMGVKLECTCTPYYIHSIGYGDHIAWAESSAVIYANSVIGARTNREGGPSALAAAIIGKTPFYGLHMIEKRTPVLTIEIDGNKAIDRNEDIFGALGYIAGRKAGNSVPIFTGIKPNRDQLKSMGAAMAATGAVGLFHVDGITPESRIFKYRVDALERITIEAKEVEELFRSMDVDAVAIGCPHCSEDELLHIERLMGGKSVKKPLYIFASRHVIDKSRRVVERIRKAGGFVIADTCMVVSPMLERYRTIMVNSGKALAYVPDMCGSMARLGSLEDCIREAIG